MGTGIVNSKLWDAVIDRCGDDIEAVAEMLKAAAFNVKDTAGYPSSQTVRGGVPAEAMDVETLSLKNRPDVYITGEMLDVDGICGGYNLQWAWATGYIAGTGAAGGKL